MVSMRHVEGSLSGFGRRGLWVFNWVELLCSMCRDGVGSETEGGMRGRKEQIVAVEPTKMSSTRRRHRLDGGELLHSRGGNTKPAIA